MTPGSRNYHIGNPNDVKQSQNYEPVLSHHPLEDGVVVGAVRETDKIAPLQFYLKQQRRVAGSV